MSSQIPALTLPLQGLHLIEASAGTGKTWTLSVLIVRLILQGKRNPSHMIATTFTRAAAAELRGRIRGRIEEIRSLFAQRLDLEKDHLAGKISANAYQQRLQVWQDFVQADAFRVDVMASDAGQDWNYAHARLQYALDSFDDLFVGTLDSFCQKLLHEFAFDSGQSEQAQISEQERELIGEIVHDALRRWRSEQPADVIALLLADKKLKSVDDYDHLLSTVMNFLSAELVRVDMPVVDLSEIHTLLAELQQIDVEPYREFMLPSGAPRAVMNKKGEFIKYGEYFFSFIEKLNTFGLPVLLNLKKDDPEAKLLSGFLQVDKQFNKGGVQEKARFEQLSGLDVFERLGAAREALKDSLAQVEAHLQYVLCQQVREQLPIKLAERGETTFAQQMRKLADALDDPDFGEELARQIRYRYPIALVDEFQDTNSDQDRMIARIYRQHADPNSCLILVGDPKQAIYGFRGGDVQTYLAARRYIEQHPQGQVHGLTVNQRSIAPLVTSVDHLFGQQSDMGEQIAYPRVQAGARSHGQLCDAHGRDQYPLRLITLQESHDECNSAAWQVLALLKQAQAGQLVLRDSTGKTRGIVPHDVAVLAHGNRELDAVEQVLHGAGVPIARPSRQSVFASKVAQDMAALMQAMLTPYHEQRVRRALSGVLGGWTLRDLDQLDQDPQALATQQAAFAEEGMIWQQQGFLAAWNQLADRLEMYPQVASVAHGDRHLSNVRHLLELLHEQSEWSAGTHHLLAWLSRQIAKPLNREWEMERRLPSQAGVQLMTIHASKGLEFPIVLVVGMDRRRKRRGDVKFFMQQDRRKLSFATTEQNIIDQHDERHQSEQRRLAYVALTRASHRVYVMLKAHSKAPRSDEYESVMRYWLGAEVHSSMGDCSEPIFIGIEQPDAPDFVYCEQHDKVPLIARRVPSRRFDSWGMTSFSAMVREHDPYRLSHAIDQPDHDQDVTDEDVQTLDVDEMPAVMQAAVPSLPRPVSEVLHQILPTLPLDVETFDLTPPTWSSVPVEQWAPMDETMQQDDAQAHFDFDQPALMGLRVEDQQWSFEIAPHALSEAPPMIAWQEAEAWLEREQALWAEDVVELMPQLEVIHDQAEDRARFEFPKGTTSGNCLHKILEYLDPNKPDIWHQTFAKQMKEHNIQGIDPQSLVPWFDHILHAPLPDGAHLASIGFRERVREMEFFLALPQGEIVQERLRHVLKEQQIEIPPLRQTQSVHYLKGTMDLVYQHQGRFYVADYKSNWLSMDKHQGQLADYHVDHLPQAMQAHHYGLQAALYVVALHRYLKIRVSNYAPDQHLGGAVYLFLRGMHQQHADHGVFHWQPPADWIERLDAALNGEAP